MIIMRSLNGVEVVENALNFCLIFETTTMRVMSALAVVVLFLIWRCQMRKNARLGLLVVCWQKKPCVWSLWKHAVLSPLVFYDPPIAWTMPVHAMGVFRLWALPAGLTKASTVFRRCPVVFEASRKGVSRAAVQPAFPAATCCRPASLAFRAPAAKGKQSQLFALCRMVSALNWVERRRVYRA